MPEPEVPVYELDGGRVVFGEAQDHRGKGPRNGRRDDERVRLDVCDALTWDPQVDASELVVEVQQGQVTLSGTVPERRQKRRAVEVAERVRGVDDVHATIRVASNLQTESTITGTSREGWTDWAPTS